MGGVARREGEAITVMRKRIEWRLAAEGNGEWEGASTAAEGRKTMTMRREMGVGGVSSS